jgi:polyhydroxyalkanoate synthase
MLGIPGPARVAAAAANFYDAAVRGGLADLRRMPAALIDRGRLRSLYRYLPVEQAAPRNPSPPVLLVPPLAAPAFCFDLRRGCSLAEHLLLAGREVYLVDYGEIEFSDRTLGLEHWFDEVIPEAIRATSADAGGRAGGVNLIGWSLGGILALLTHAGDAELPVGNVALIGSPFDFSRVPMVAPLRPIAAVTRGQGITQLYRALGVAPAPLVRGGYQLAGIEKYLMKPFTIASNLDDRDMLAQIEAVNHFMARMHAYPGRTFGQLYHRFFRTNDLALGRLGLSGRTTDLADVTAPLLAVAGLGDGIAPVAACHHVGDLVPNAASVELATAPGGHLGVLTGRAARATTWNLLDKHLDR